MSTFNGIVKEFPEIRIDYFRIVEGQPPPLACFLSHVHSDHLQGLESFKSPFLYCSPATKEILLRLEKYPHRMNFVKGILEAKKVTYSKLKRLLKTIPLETPTTIELSPSKKLRVTLFDANHCVGSVMFLIQDGRKAILYTGDVRSETWWVNSLVRNPILLPFALGSRRLDCIYLDTTFATRSEYYTNFPSKAEGIHELLRKVEKYPKDTIFHLEAWTFGYEDVWIALSEALRSQIHLDRYRYSLYTSISSKTGELQAAEGSIFCGFQCGNHFNPGCLTNNTSVRLHSCEHGNPCPVFTDGKPVVWIRPIVTRTRNGEDIPELGAGGGKGDLDEFHELEVNDDRIKALLSNLYRTKYEDDPETKVKLEDFLSSFDSARQSTIRLNEDDVKGSLLEKDAMGDLNIEELAELIANVANNRKVGHSDHALSCSQRKSEVVKDFPDEITFPYSRHSSYSELCELIQAFNPRDIYPCVVDYHQWNNSLSMKALFGHLCPTASFVNDSTIMEMVANRTRSKLAPETGSQVETQDTTRDEETQKSMGLNLKSLVFKHLQGCERSTSVQVPRESPRPFSISGTVRIVSEEDQRLFKRRKLISSIAGTSDKTTPSEVISTLHEEQYEAKAISQSIPSTVPLPSKTTIHHPRNGILAVSSTALSWSGPCVDVERRKARAIRLAHDAALGLDGLNWFEYGGLVSVNNHSVEEQEL
ncbi:hypothetical protein M501DRAFT_1016430 [Patellaria atrata CBS 101060]|uniref:Protein artemis n=1 Tax=Patellaria atrata CBS 101060 TaxID=1346257 RepID=A0A9P4VN49_9PEZI|nr:hypothetical protein M501DRAFT_1016430 [Patellaria atrata CBS 101060]